MHGSALLNRRDVGERSIYGNCRFNIGRSRASRLITKVSIPGVRYTHIAVPTITRSYATRNPESGIKDGFEEVEHAFPFRIFLPEK